MPASDCVRLTRSITDNLVMVESGLYKISMVVFTTPSETIFSAIFEFWDKLTRASAAGSDTSYNIVEKGHSK